MEDKEIDIDSLRVRVDLAKAILMCLEAGFDVYVTDSVYRKYDGHTLSVDYIYVVHNDVVVTIQHSALKAPWDPPTISVIYKPSSEAGAGAAPDNPEVTVANIRKACVKNYIPRWFSACAREAVEHYKDWQDYKEHYLHKNTQHYKVTHNNIDFSKGAKSLTELFKEIDSRWE